MEEIELYAEIGALMNIEEIKTHLVYIKEKVDKLDEDNTRDHQQLFSKINDLTGKFAEQKVRVGFIGTISGMVPAGLVLIYLWARNLLKTQGV